MLSCVRLFETPWTVAHQAPLSMKFSRQEYWSGLCFLLHGDLHDPGIEPTSPALQADSLSLYHLESPMSNKYMFIWVGKNKDSESIPCLENFMDTGAWLQSMGFPSQVYWSGLPFPSLGDLPDPGIKPTSPALQADSLLLNHQKSPM